MWPSCVLLASKRVGMISWNLQGDDRRSGFDCKALKTKFCPGFDILRFFEDVIHVRIFVVLYK